MRRFDGRAAFVTGGGHGIGQATARRLASEGAAVAVTDVDIEAAEKVTRELTDGGATAATYHCDVTDRVSVDAAMAGALERFGRLDILISNAGNNLSRTSEDEPTDEEWIRQFDFSFVGAQRCIRAAMPALVDSPAGAVVLVGSAAGVAAFGTEPYGAAKAGLVNLTRNFAARYGPLGVRFNLVAPGTVATRVFDTRPDALDKLEHIYPLGRVGQPDDIAAAIAFLASDDAAWITGITLPVEGGLLTGPAPMIERVLR